jgi:hypothetical protein
MYFLSGTKLLFYGRNLLDVFTRIFLQFRMISSSVLSEKISLKSNFFYDSSCSSDEASFDGNSFENPADIYTTRFSRSG